MKKKEMTRLINMVMLAEKSDPRITADKVRFSLVLHSSVDVTVGGEVPNARLCILQPTA